MPKAATFTVDLDALPPSQRPKDYVPAPGKGPKNISETPLRSLMRQRDEQPPGTGHQPTAQSREGVMHAAAFGVDPNIIAKIAGISPQELKTVYADEIEIGRSVITNDLQTNLYNIGCDKHHKDSARTSMWLLERLGGDLYRAPNRMEITGPGGRPLQIEESRTIDPALLTPEKRELLREIVISAMQLAQSPEPEPAPQFSAIGGRYEQIALMPAQTPSIEDLLS